MPIPADFEGGPCDAAVDPLTFCFTNTSPEGYDPNQTKWIVSAAGLTDAERLAQGTTYGPGVEYIKHTFLEPGYYTVSIHISGGGKIGKAYQDIKVGDPPAPEPPEGETEIPAPPDGGTETPDGSPAPDGQDDMTLAEGLEFLIREIARDEIGKQPAPAALTDAEFEARVLAVLKKLFGA